MSIDDVDIVELHSLEGRLETLDDVFPAETFLIWVLSLRSEEDLGRHDNLLPLQFELFESFAHLDFAVSCSVSLGIVE